METRSYKLEALDTPAPLRRCSDKGILLLVTAKGNLEILHKPLVGFFCSVRCPGDIILKTYGLARALNLSALEFDAIANGDDGVETVEVRVVMLTVSGSYKEFLYN